MTARSLPRLAVLVFVAAACSSGPIDEATAASDVAPTTSTVLTTDSSAGLPTTQLGTGQPVAAADLCAGLVASTSGRVSDDDLIETSGLVASVDHDVLWAHNDSGGPAEIFAMTPAGEAISSFTVPVDQIDTEAIGLADGVLHLADIGDNSTKRADVVVYRFAEPDPSTGEPIGKVDEIRLSYPDGPHDAEAFAVDPRTGDFIIIDKKLRIGGPGGGLLSAAPATIFVASPPLDPGSPVTLEARGSVDLPGLEARSEALQPGGLVGESGAGGLATGLDIHPSGSMIALRTYASVWLFPRAEGQSVSEALSGEGCEAPTVVEDQGEAVAFLGDASVGFVTVAEGVNPPINATLAAGATG